MPESLMKIQVDKIDLQGDLYSCSWPHRSPVLEASIQRTGLLRPITVIRKDERLCVVSGFRRAKAVKRLGHSHVQCRLLDPPLPSDATLFIMNLEENLSSRSLNFFETALAVKRLSEDLDLVDTKTLETYLALLSVKNEASTLHQWLALNRLDEEVKLFLLDRGFAERLARLFLKRSKEEAEALLKAGAALKLTASQIKELAEMGEEIAQRDGLSFPAVVREIMESLGPDLKETSRSREAFIRNLRKRRLPAYSGMKAAVDECLGKVNGVAGVRVHPSPLFESDAFSAVITFRTRDELATRAKKLLEFTQSEELSKALKLVQE